MSSKNKPTPPPPTPSSAKPRASLSQSYLLIASFFTGALILVVEIVGQRVISPYYGSSVYVWSSIITVTLAALTTGYFIGGRIADAKPGLAVFAAEVVIGGLLVALIPFLRSTVLVATDGLGLKLGSLLAATLLFFLPLMTLSMTGPMAIRLVTNEFAFMGRGIGLIYGISTLGSMTGAVVSGFFLIPNFSVRGNLLAAAAGLIFLGATGWIIARKRAAGAAGQIAAVAMFMWVAQTPTLASNVIYMKNSFYGELKVFDADNERYLLINGANHGNINLSTMKTYATSLLDMSLAPHFHPAGKKALLIGLGAGSLPVMLAENHQVVTDSVEIDNEIVKIAFDYFGYKSEGKTVVEDGRTYVENTPERYDFVFLDAFNSEVAPFHLYTTEFFGKVNNILRPGGLVVLNTVGFPYGPESRGWKSTYRTLKTQFEYIRIFKSPDSLPQNTSDFTNLIIFASHAPLEPALKTAELSELFGRELTIPGDWESAGILLTDDYNPMESLNRPLFVALRRYILDNARSAILYDGYSL